LETRPEARALHSQQSFRERLRDFIDAAPSLDPGERRSGADDLAGEVARMESAGSLLPSQALFLRVALIRATATDEETFSRQAGALVAEESERSEARRTASERSLVAANAEYRQREARIVAEVMATPDLSDATSRQQVLRKRLQALRTELYER
jgi:hypothetical protein